MPGKVNPVIAESLLMVCAQVIGYDATIAWCGAAGNFELNVMMPVMAYDLIESVQLLGAGGAELRHRLVAGLEADRERATGFVEQSLAMGTALAPEIGYENAAILVKNAYLTGRTVTGSSHRTERPQSGKNKRTPGPGNSGRVINVF